MIVIPMAGQSRRFSEAGYTLPKYQLPVGDQSLFSLTIRSFEAAFDNELFVFAYRDVANTREFIQRECARLGIAHAHLHEIEGATDGQAHTVNLGVRSVGLNTDPLVIFNIDTIRHGWQRPAFAGIRQPDGYLEVVREVGDGWSFVEPGEDNTVLRTTEKVRISDLCSTGLYGFASAELFSAAFEEARRSGETVNGEYYVAPLYNSLIRSGQDIRYYEIERRDVTFSGVPAEYEALRSAVGPESAEA